MLVAVTLAPFADAVQAIGGDAVDVRRLFPPGTDPFERNATPPIDEDVASRADLIVYGGPLIEPRTSAFISGASGVHAAVVNASRGSTLLASSSDASSTARDGQGADPYFWLDADNAIAMANAIRDALISVDPARADAYRERAQEYEAAIRKADVDASGVLHDCRTRMFIEAGGLHFAYLARRYNLTYLSAHPDPAGNPPDLAGFAELIREKTLPVIFYENGDGPKIAATIANLTDASTSPLESGSTFLSAGHPSVVDILTSDANALASGMECIR